MKELVVISGKGGTGKTSIVASFAALARRVVLADCDVDAADLHLVLQPEIRHRADFSGGYRAAVLDPLCSACGACLRLCRFDAVSCIPRPGRSDRFEIDPIACEGCGLCVRYCPPEAIAFGPAINGDWFISETRFGPMVHAKLGVAEENSGKLVSLVRSEAKALADTHGADWLIIDGAPGVGCPVIASLAGAQYALVVTEPTASGLSDLKRVAELTRHFGIPTLLCVNKWDLNPDVTGDIERWSAAHDVMSVGRVRYDPAVTEAQLEQVALTEYTPTGAGADLRTVWAAIGAITLSQETH